YSEKTAEQIDVEVKELIDRAYENAKRILVENLEGHTKLADLLLEREVIFSEDLEQIFGPRKTLSREQELAKELDEESHKNEN
ncbi:MAG TPA: cell division protein FtsH, partial [Tenuifilaceae bacterium]|nr:cell division protein FtsH [Tenuifilaceae bacterium]